MRVVFMGTPEFSVPTLQYLIANHEVAAVFTQLDKKSGRGGKVSMSPVKEIALSKGITVHQPVRIKKGDWTEILRELKPEVVVVIAYGQILSKEILDVPTLGSINVHASLLPELRGASPINMAIVNGLSETGITTMMMDVGLDTGDMLDKEKIEITSSMTASDLHDVLKEIAPKVLDRTMKKLENGTLVRIKQDDELATYAPILKREDGFIDFEMSSKDIINKIRGFYPWPGSYTLYEGSTMKIFSADSSSVKSSELPGTILEVTKEGILVKTGDGAILIKEIQMPSKKRMDVSSYILGNEIKEKVKLGG